MTQLKAGAVLDVHIAHFAILWVKWGSLSNPIDIRGEWVDIGVDAHMLMSTLD